MKNSHIVYAQRPDATTEGEVAALANVYRFLINSQSRRGRLLDKSGPEDPERRSDEIRARTRIP
jgi:hypothetical protein